jgi:hypothetical protein
MAKKQTSTKQTANESFSAGAAKARAPRVKAAQHSKTVASEPVVVAPVHQGSSESAREVISEIAYSYWEERGWEHGAHVEDWLRAENEYRKRIASATRL